jgi:hypothetical protein
MKKAILILALSGLLAGCGGYSARERGGVVTVTMEEYAPAMRNPMKGLREYFNPGVDSVRPEYPYPYGSMIKEYIQWNMIENDASDGVDKIIDYCNHRWAGVEDINMKVIPRVFIVWVEPWHGGRAKDPANPDDMNGWHWPSDIPGETGPYKQIPGSVGAYVDPCDSLTPIIGGYFDPRFPERVERLVEKLGRAWNDDPRVAYVEMGIVGEWGEHHDPDLSTYWPPHDEPEHVVNRTWLPGIEKTLGDSFTKAFPDKKVMVRYAYEFRDYEFGIYWDSWAITQEIVRGYGEMLKLGDRWKTQVIGGEITWNWGDLAAFRSFEAVVANDSIRSRVIEQIRNLHCNHLGGITWADFNDPEFQRNAALLQKALGYRFVPDTFRYPAAVEAGKPFEVSFSLTNTGSSPFYYDWPVEVALLDAKTRQRVAGRTLGVKISEWMPGEKWDAERETYTVAAPVYDISETVDFADVAPGEYIIALAILDPAGMLPSVRFAVTNYFEGGYHPMGYIGVGGKPARTALDKADFYDLQNDRTLYYKL